MTTDNVIEASLAGNDGGIKEAVQPATDQQKFIETLPEAYRADPVFKNFGGLEDLARSYKAASSMVGLDKNQVLRIPTEDTPEAWGEIWNKLGRPENEDGYKFDSLKELPGFSEEKYKAFAKVAYENGITDKGFNALQAMYAEDIKSQMGGMKEAEGTQVKDWQEGLKQEYGQAYPEKLKLAQAAVAKFGGEELVGLIKSAPAAFENPAIIKAFVAMGEQMQKIADQTKEDNGFLPAGAANSGARTPNQAKAELAELEASDLYKKVAFDPTHPQRQSIMDKRTKLYEYAYAGS